MPDRKLAQVVDYNYNSESNSESHTLWKMINHDNHFRIKFYLSLIFIKNKI